MKELFQLTKEQAIALYESRLWESWSDEELARFQFYQNKLCVPFGRFHKGMEKLLGRPIWTHEFAFKDKLQEELEGKRAAPTMEEIINLIPEEKRIVIGIDRSGG